MPSIKVTAATCLALFIGARADYYVDPTTVPALTRSAWCAAQVSVCPLICLQFSSASPLSNTCDFTSLAYSCVCANGQSPNASEYSQTIPFFLCQQWGQQCVAGCGSDTTCQSNCIQDHPCGAQNPVRVNVTSSSASSSPTASSGSATTGVVDGFASTTSPSNSNTKNGALSALNLGQSYGLAVVLTGVFAGFALLL